MNAKVRKEWEQMTPASQRRVNDYWAQQYGELLEKNMRIMLDLYMKMVCVTLNDKLDMEEDELMLFLGHHRELFREQVKMVHSDEQIEYLDRRMAEIFTKNGFPQGFFDKMLGSVETAEQERNGVRVLNDSPVDCQTPSVTEPQRDERGDKSGRGV